MTEAEKRRIELLHQTRTLYSDRIDVPAVHPRYRSVYGELYHPEGNSGRNSTLGIRVFISILLFILFAAADYNEVRYRNVDSKRIVHEIERKTDLDLLK